MYLTIFLFFQRYAPHIIQLLQPTFRYLLLTYSYNPEEHPGTDDYFKKIQAFKF